MSEKDCSTAKSGIYQIRCTVDGKIYIGSAVNIAKRWASHRCQLRKGRHGNRHLRDAWQLHGESRFAFEILELVASRADLIAVEQAHLDRTRSFDRNIGYNVCERAGNGHVQQSRESIERGAAARRGSRRSPEARAKMSAAQTGRKQSAETIAKRAASLTGKKRTPEIRAKQSANFKGRKITPEWRAKISAAHKGKKRKPPSPETREKISAANAGRTRTPDAVAKMSASQKARWSDSDERAKQSARTKAYNDGRIWTPEERAKCSAYAKIRWDKLDKEARRSTMIAVRGGAKKQTNLVQTTLWSME